MNSTLVPKVDVANRTDNNGNGGDKDDASKNIHSQGMAVHHRNQTPNKEGQKSHDRKLPNPNRRDWVLFRIPEQLVANYSLFMILSAEDRARFSFNPHREALLVLKSDFAEAIGHRYFDYHGEAITLDPDSIVSLTEYSNESGQITRLNDPPISIYKGGPQQMLNFNSPTPSNGKK